MWTIKRFSSFATTFAAGFVGALLVTHELKSGRPLAIANEGASVAGDEADDTSAQRADYERQIADLKKQLELAMLQSSTETGANASAPPTVLESMKLEQESHMARLSVAQKIETEKLLAAGFTMDRIEWIRKRGNELIAEFRRKTDLIKLQGARRDTSAELAHEADSDIDLRYEMGDDEYTRYRQALGRPIGMILGEVQPGGLGESGGLKVNDEIVAYNGTRVFNIGELNPLIVKYREAGTSVPVDVIRNGQKVHLTVSPGDLRIRSVRPGLTTQDRLRDTPGVFERLGENIGRRGAESVGAPSR